MSPIEVLGWIVVAIFSVQAAAMIAVVIGSVVTKLRSQGRALRRANAELTIERDHYQAMLEAELRKSP